MSELRDRLDCAREDADALLAAIEIAEKLCQRIRKTLDLYDPWSPVEDLEDLPEED